MSSEGRDEGVSNESVLVDCRCEQCFDVHTFACYPFQTIKCLLSPSDVDTQHRNSKSEADNFQSLVHGLSEVVPDTVLRERLEADTLETLGLVPDAKNFMQKGIKMKTKLLYELNLFVCLSQCVCVCVCVFVCVHTYITPKCSFTSIPIPTVATSNRSSIFFVKNLKGIRS